MRLANIFSARYAGIRASFLKPENVIDPFFLR